MREINREEMEALKKKVELLLDPSARLELGEGSTRASFAALGEQHLLALIERCERFEFILYPADGHEDAAPVEP